MERCDGRFAQRFMTADTADLMVETLTLFDGDPIRDGGLPGRSRSRHQVVDQTAGDLLLCIR